MFKAVTPQTTMYITKTTELLPLVRHLCNKYKTTVRVFIEKPDEEDSLYLTMEYKK